MASFSVRTLRLGAAAVLSVAVGWAMLPYVTSYVSTQAVVNAPLKTVLSPIRGHIVRRSPPPGSPVAPGAPLVTVEADAAERGRLEDLRAQLAQLAEAEASVTRALERLAVLAAEMEQRVAAYRARTLERIAAERRAAEARLEAAAARRLRAAQALERARTLAAEGHAAEARLEDARTAHAEAEAEVHRVEAVIARLEVEAEAMAAGVSVQEGWNDVPYSRQRLDEIRLRQGALEAERDRIRGERAALVQRLAVEERLLARRERFAPPGPAGGVVWKASGPAGDSVVPGDPLVEIVDCQARFLEVALPESRFGRIRPGDPAWVRLRGGGPPITARVTAVLGAGARFDHPRLAAEVPEVPAGRLRVLVSLSESGLGSDPAAFCHVGRTAEVRFRRPSSDALGRLRELVASVGASVGASVMESVGLTAARAASRH